MFNFLQEKSVMKKVVFAVLVAMFGFLATGCLDDSNDSTPPQYLEMGVVETGAADELFVVTDSELTLRLAAYSADFDFVDGKRIVLEYSVKERAAESEDYDYLVNVHSVQEVVTKEIVELDEESRDTIGSDQIYINEIWVSAGYLNIDFSFYGNDKTHFINVVKDPEEQPADVTEILLQVRHDARDDAMVSRYRGLMSFYLESLQVEGADKVSLVFENQNFYAAPYSTLEIEYEY
jgi:hypothetical protein